MKTLKLSTFLLVLSSLFFTSCTTSTTTQSTDTPTPKSPSPTTAPPIAESTPTPTQTNTPLPLPPEGQILFHSNEPADMDIFVINTDGSNRIRLTFPPNAGLFPRLSSDGSKITYTDLPGETAEIYVMDADGSNPIRLTDNEDDDTYSDWSPNGDKIVFISNRNGNFDIFVMNDDGTNVIQLTDTKEDDIFPAWSSDGTQIAFSTAFEDHMDIFVINPDGSGLTQLTDGVFRSWLPGWSPDSSHIAYSSSNAAGNMDIYVMDIDGANQIRLTTDRANDFFPSWSMDGQYITFSSDRTGNRQVFIMNADGSSQIRVTNSEAEDWYPSWVPVPISASTSSSPSNLIAYTHFDHGMEIYMMTADGLNQTQLTNLGEIVYGASWSPDGSKIVFILNYPDPEENEIWIIDVLTGEEPRKLTGNIAGPVSDLSWSPDGKYLVFSDPPPSGFDLDIYKLEVATGERINLTQDNEWDNAPVWSPTGDLIAFVSDRFVDDSSLDDIWVMEPDGSNPVNLTNNGMDWEDIYPAWSPDGQKIAFSRMANIVTSPEEGSPPGLWVMNADGTDQVNIAAFDLIFGSGVPVWSPNGEYIAYTDGLEDTTEVWIVSSDGSQKPINVSNMSGEDNSISWAPDSESLIFTNYYEGEWHLYSVSVDGTGLRRILDTVMSGFGDWSP